MWYSVLIGDEEADSVAWSAVATVAVVCLAVLGTLWGSLVLVARATPTGLAWLFRPLLPVVVLVVTVLAIRPVINFKLFYHSFLEFL